MRRPKVYLAGPEVFLPEAVNVGLQKKELCRKYNLEGLFPFDNEISDSGKTAGADVAIYRANVAMMRRADCAIFNLTPFRGPSADVGTVFELGMCVALDKPVFAYTNDQNDLLDRISQSGRAAFESSSGTWRDSEGMVIENFQNADNLMIEAALKEQGRTLIRYDAPRSKRFSDLTAFEKCLGAVAEHFGDQEPRVVRARVIG